MECFKRAGGTHIQVDTFAQGLEKNTTFALSLHGGLRTKTPLYACGDGATLGFRMWPTPKVSLTQRPAQLDPAWDSLEGRWRACGAAVRSLMP